jgi:hypothetical protein
MKTIGFWDNNLGLRGTSVAMFLYAKYNEEILGNRSIIYSHKEARTDLGDKSTLEKFEKQFPSRVHLVGRELGSFYDVQTHMLREYNAEYFYYIKAGQYDGGILDENYIKNLIHAVFLVNEPHGHRYMYVSDWLAGTMGYHPRESHAVPHIVEPLPHVDEDLRDELNIPKNATVFGCYGGPTEFNINFVHHSMDRIVSERNDIYFIFMNIPNTHHDITHTHENYRWLPGTWDLVRKAKFVKTCDAMLHARIGGETFGMAVAEFSSANKPVITYGLSGERCHLEILGERGIIYNNYEEVYDILNNIGSYLKYEDWNCYRNFSPEIIMNRFDKNFLN